MRFGSYHLLWLLLVVPPAMALFYWWSARARQKLMSQFIQSRLLPGLLAGVSPAREKIRAALMIGAITCLILALAGPQWGYNLEEIKQRGLDIVVAIDTSKSMLAEDIPPNRLTRAKYAALDLMQQAKSDRLGLVAFAGTAFLQCPMTIDDSAFRQSLEMLDVNTLPEGGTALAEAIRTAQTAFKEGDGHKVLVLFTDGEDHDSAAVEAAEKAAEKSGLKIFTVGIGSPEGELLRIKSANGQKDYVRDENGNVVKSHLNEDLLRKIAGAGNGFYMPLKGAKTIDTLYENGLAPLPKSDSQEKWVKRARERYHWPLGAAIVLLIVEIFFPERKRETRPVVTMDRTKIIAKVIVLLFLTVLPGTTLASPSGGMREYQSGKYEEALKQFEESLQKKTDDPRLHFNAGASAYRSEKFEQASRHFEQALISPDLNLQQQAYYNLGNTLYELGEKSADPQKKTEAWEDAMKRYESSLKLNPEDADAKFNRDYVMKKLEELKQQQSSDQDQKDQKDQEKQDQQDSDSKQQSDQKQDQDKQNSQTEDQKKNQHPESASDKKESPEKNRPQKPSEQQTQDQEPPDQQEAEAAEYAPGQMTPKQARQLLDSQKEDEMILPAKSDKKAAPRHGPVKDW